MAQFVSAYIGNVEHPVNILHEYLEAFGNKCQAAILSWLDGWAHTKGAKGELDSWVWLVLEDLATELGYCRDTINRHLKALLEMGIVERDRARRWCTDRAWKYRIVPEILSQYLSENQTINIDKSDYGESEISTIDSLISDDILNTVPNPPLTQPQQAPAAGKKKVVEEEVSKEEQREIDSELRRLRINPSDVRRDIKRHRSNLPGAIARVKKALNDGWCQNPTGLFRKTLTEGVPEELQPIAPKEYPRPTLEQLNELGTLGTLVHTVLNEPGYPDVLGVDTGSGVVLWWDALRLDLPLGS